MSLFDQLPLSLIHTHKSSRVKCISFHPELPLALLGLYSGSVCLLNYRTRSVNTISISKNTTRACCFLTYPPGKNEKEGTKSPVSYIVTGSDDGYIRFIDLQTHVVKFQIHAHSDFIRCVCCHPALPILFSCGDDGLIKAWQYANLDTPTIFLGELYPLTILVGHDRFVMSLCCDPSGLRMISSSTDGTVKCWDISKNSLFESMKNKEKISEQITANSLPIEVPGSGIEAAGKTLMKVVSDKVGGAADNALNKILGVIGDKSTDMTKKVSIDDMPIFTNKIQCMSTFSGHTQSVNSACWFNGSTSTDQSSNTPGIVTGPNLKNKYFYGGLDYILTGGEDSLIKAFDTQTKSCVSTLSHCTKAVTCTQFVPDIACCLAGSEDGTLSFINTNTMGLDRSVAIDMGRIWCTGVTKQFSAIIIAVGTDEGCVLFRVGNPIPPIAVSNKIYTEITDINSDMSDSDDDSVDTSKKEIIKFTIGGELINANKNNSEQPLFSTQIETNIKENKFINTIEETGLIRVSPGSYVSGICSNNNLLTAISKASKSLLFGWKNLQASQMSVPIESISYSANNNFISVVSPTDYTIYTALTLKKKITNLCSAFAFASAGSPENFSYENFMNSSNKEVLDEYSYTQAKKTLIMQTKKIMQESYFAYVPHNNTSLIILSSVQKQGEPIASIKFDFEVKALIGGPYLTAVSNSGFMLLLDWTRSLKLVCQLNLTPTKIFWNQPGDMMAISVPNTEKETKQSEENETNEGDEENYSEKKSNNKIQNKKSTTTESTGSGKTFIVLMDSILVNAYIEAGENFYDEEEGIPTAVSLVGKIDVAIDSAAFSQNGSMLVYGVDYNSAPNSAKAMLTQAHSDGAITSSSISSSELITNVVFSIIILKNYTARNMTLSSPVAHIIPEVKNVLAVLQSAESKSTVSVNGENDIESILLLAESGNYINPTNIYETNILSVIKSKIDLTMMRFHKMIEGDDFDGAINYIIKRADRGYTIQEILHIVDSLKIAVTNNTLDQEKRDVLCFKVINTPNILKLQKHEEENKNDHYMILKFIVAERIGNVKALLNLIEETSDSQRLVRVLGINRLRIAATAIFKAGLVQKAYELYCMDAINDLGMQLLCAYVMLDLKMVTDVSKKALIERNFSIAYRASILMGNISGTSESIKKNANRLALLALLCIGGESALELSSDEIASIIRYSCDTDAIVTPEGGEFNGADAYLFVKNHPEIDDSTDNELQHQLLRRWNILSAKHN